MTDSAEDANSNTPKQTQFPSNFRIVPIERGQDRTKWKAPTTRGWNDDERAATYPNELLPGYNGGLCHKQSNTCTIDIDNLRRCRELFSARHMDLRRLLMTGVQWSSGRENRSKLLYKLPQEVWMLGNYPRTRQITDENNQVIMEFRCVYGTGKTAQDVVPGSIHPNGNVYQVVGDMSNIPELPPEIMAWWQELIPNHVEAGPSEAYVQDTPENRAKVKRALAALDPDMSYTEWREVGVALHATGWHDAFDLWHDWSAQGSLYAGFEEVEDKWADMTHGGGIDTRKLYAMAYAENPNWERPSPEEMFQALSQDQGSLAPVVIDESTQEVVVDIMALCQHLEFNPPQEDLNAALVHIAQCEDALQRDTYILVVADKTQIRRPVIRARIDELRSTGENAMVPGITWVQTNRDGDPLSTLDNFIAMVQQHGFTIRYNIMTRTVENYRNQGRVFIQDAQNLGLLTELKSLAIEHGMRTDMTKEYRDSMAYANAYHPFHDYLAAQTPYTYSEPDYMQLLCNSLIVAPEHVELRNKLVKTWVISVVAAAFMTWDRDMPPVRGVLVLQGPQQMGKSYWFEKLLPVGMVKSGASINKNDMNHLKTATNRLIVELAEAEFNNRNQDMVAYLKSIVGRSVDELRKAYDSEEVQLLRRSVFCITTNPGTFLQDDENSRYFTVPCLDINRMIYNMIPMDRLWAQASAMYSAGVPYLLDNESSVQLQALNEEHRALSRFEDWLLDTFNFETMEGVGNPETCYTRSDINLMAKDNVDVSTGDAIDILKRLTKQTRAVHTHINGKQGRWWKLPSRNVVDGGV